MTHQQMFELEQRLARIFNLPRQRLLRYALAPEFLSDYAFDGLPALAREQANCTQFLQRYPRCIALYWVRCFFERGDGNNYRECLNEALGKQLQQYDLSQVFNGIADTCKLPMEDQAARRRFLAECWVVKNGPASEIWKTLIPLVRITDVTEGAPPVAEQLTRYAENESLPSYFEWLIAQQDSSFIDSIVALKNQTGEGWLGRITPLWETHSPQGNSATAGWRLYVNGQQKGVILAVRNICIHAGSRTVVVRQGPRDLLKRTFANGTAQVRFSMEDLRQANCDLSAEISIYVGAQKVESVKPISSDQPALFRYSSGASDLPLIFENTAHVYTPRVAALLPPGSQQQEFIHGNNSVTAEHLGFYRLPHEIQPRRLVLLSFVDLANIEPQPLTWENQLLLYVGTKPYLDASNIDMDVRCFGENGPVIIFDTQAIISLRSSPNGGNPPNWAINGNAAEPSDDGLSSIRIQAANAGETFTVSCDRATLPVRLLFLPVDLRRPLLNGSVLPDGWAWNPEPDLQLQLAAAERGLREGTLIHDSLSARLSLPLKSRFWYWQKTAIGEPQSVNQRVDCNAYSDAGIWLLCICVPENQNLTVRLCYGDTGQAINLRTLTSGTHRIWLTELFDGHLRFDQGVGDAAIDRVVIGETDAVHILRVPNVPALTWHQRAPHVFFPSDSAPASYTVLVFREDALGCGGPIASISCREFHQGLSPLNVQRAPLEGEGVWLVLVSDVRSVGINNLIIFGISQPRIVGELELQPPDQSPLRGRLEGWLNDSMTDVNITTARLILDRLAKHKGLTKTFAAAMQCRDLLPYTQKRAYWDEHFQQHCQLDQLSDGLGLMLRAGFNWCAAPGWFKWAYQQIREKLTSDGQRWTQQNRQELDSICPAIKAQIPIECGYPLATQLAAVTRYSGVRMQRQDWNVPLLQDLFQIRHGGQAFGLVVPPDNQDPVGIHEFSVDGIKIVGNNNPKAVCFEYRGQHLVRVRADFERFRVAVRDDALFLRHVVDRIKDDDGVPIPGHDDRRRLEDAFDTGLQAATQVVGQQNDRGLAYMFKLSADRFSEVALCDDTQQNRPIIFQAAVLCRLHAWLGYNGANHPNGWPLSEPNTYALVCAVVNQAWQRPACREALMADLIPVEWFIAWFHS